MSIEEKQIILQQNISKIGSFNNSHLELIINDQSSQDPKMTSSLRLGDNRRRMLLDDNTSPIQPKTDAQDGINNPSNNSFFQTKQIINKFKDSSPNKQQQILNSQNYSSSPILYNSPFRISNDQDKMSQLQSQLNNDIPHRSSALNITNRPHLSLRVSLLAKRFAQRFKLKASNILFQKLTDKQLKIIGDLSFSIRQHREAMNSGFQIIWNIWSFIQLVVLLILVPVKFCLEVNIFDFYEWLILGTILFLFLNIIINMNQTLRNLIDILIIKKRIDIFLLLAFLISMSSEENQFLRLAIIFKLSDIIDIYDNIQNMLEIKQKYKHYGIFLKVFFQILLIAHLAGCFFIKIGLSNKHQQNWIQTEKIQYNDYQNIYTSAIYWSVITMITVGYGDITPTNVCNYFQFIFILHNIYQIYKTEEKTYVIFVSLISCGIFGYSLNTIGYILKEKEDSKIQFQNKISELSNFMKKRQVNRDMRETIFKYFHYLHKEEITENQKVNTMIKDLPDTLRSNFLIEIYSGMISQQPFFKQTFSEAFILQICLLIKEIKIGPDMNLQDVDQLNEGNSALVYQRLYFLMKGKISYQTQSKKDRIIKYYEKGDCFGLTNFILGQANDINLVYKTCSVVMLAYIDKNEFLSLLDTFPQEKEKYFMAKDNISFNNSIEICQQKCLACQNENHDVHQCERLHLKSNKEKLYFQYNSTQSQERKLFVRDNNKRISPFYYLNLYEESETNEDFDKAKKDYITQYTSHQTFNQNQQYYGGKRQSYQTNISFQVKENTYQPSRLAKRKKTNQSTAIREDTTDNLKPILKIKEFKCQTSLGNSAYDQDIASIQNRSKRAHSELQPQFYMDQMGSNQLIQFAQPQNLNQNGNAFSMTNLAVSNHQMNQNQHNLSNFVNYAQEQTFNQLSGRDIVSKNENFANKEEFDDKTSIILEKQDESLNQSFNSLYKKRNVQKKMSKKIKGNGIFNMDDIKIKKQQNGTHVYSYTNLTDMINEDTNSAHTYNQINSNLNVQYNLAQQLQPKQHDSGINPLGNNSGIHYDEDYLDEEGQQKSQIQLFQAQIVQFKESKVFDLDSKREYQIYFPHFNSDQIIKKLQKLPQNHVIHRSPVKNNRKQSKFFRTTFMGPQGHKKSDVSSLQTKLAQKNNN